MCEHACACVCLQVCVCVCKWLKHGPGNQKGPGLMSSYAKLELQFS